MESSDEESYKYFAEDDSSSDDELINLDIDITEIGQEKSTYDEEEIQIIKEILVKTPSSLMSIKKEKQPLLQPAKEILENQQIGTSMDTRIETIQSLANSKQSSGSFVTLTPQKDIEDSNLREDVRHQHAEECSCRQLDRSALKLPRAVKRLRDWNKAGDKEKELPIRPRRRKPFARTGLTTTPITRNSVSTGSCVTTDHIHDGAVRSTSPGNEPAKKRNGDITESIKDRAIGQIARSQENLTINIGSADVTVTNIGLTVQLKLGDMSISGPADKVTNFVSQFNKFEFSSFIKK